MSPTAFRFGPFQLDVSRQRVTGPAGDIALRPKTFEVLRYLVENHGRLATKDQLLAAVWPDVTVTEESLTRCVSEIRKALGSDGTELIKTVPKRGYLIDVPVIPAPPDTDAPGPEDADRRSPALGPDTPERYRDADTSTALMYRHASGRFGWLDAARLKFGRISPLSAASVISALAVAMAAYVAFVPGRSTPAPQREALCWPPIRLAVVEKAPAAQGAPLPASTSQLSDTVRTHLARIPHFRVASGTSTGSTASAPSSSEGDAPSDYRVDILRRGDGTAQLELSRRSTGTLLWSNAFDASASEARRVARSAEQAAYAIHIAVLREEAATADGSTRAKSQLLISGWSSLIAPGPKALGSTLERFQDALDSAPACLSAQVGVAGAKALLAMDFGLDNRDAELTDARNLLETAMRSAGNDFTVHFYLGVVHTAQENPSAALQHYNRAIELNPSFAPAYAYKARTLLRLDQADNALKLIEHADAVSGHALTRWPLWAGIAHMQLGQMEAARGSFLKVLGTIPNSPFLHAALASSYALGSEWENAYQHVTVLRGRTPNMSDDWRIAHFDLGPVGPTSPGRLAQGLRLALEKYPE